MLCCSSFPLFFHCSYVNLPCLIKSICNWIEYATIINGNSDVYYHQMKCDTHTQNTNKNFRNTNKNAFFRKFINQNVLGLHRRHQHFLFSILVFKQNNIILTNYLYAKCNVFVLFHLRFGICNDKIYRLCTRAKRINKLLYLLHAVFGCSSLHFFRFYFF